MNGVSVMLLSTETIFVQKYTNPSLEIGIQFDIEITGQYQYKLYVILKLQVNTNTYILYTTRLDYKLTFGH